MSSLVIKVVSATQVGQYRLQLEFDDQTVQTVDFGPFLMRSRHPDVRAFLQPERFSAFQVIYGELVWGDYDLCFPIIDLYRNTVDHPQLFAQAA